jgi:hypothetical protein
MTESRTDASRLIGMRDHARQRETAVADPDEEEIVRLIAERRGSPTVSMDEVWAETLARTD